MGFVPFQRSLLRTSHPRDAQLDTPKINISSSFSYPEGLMAIHVILPRLFSTDKTQQIFPKTRPGNISSPAYLNLTFCKLVSNTTAKKSPEHFVGNVQQLENSQHHHCKLPLCGQNRIFALCWNSVDKLFLPASAWRWKLITWFKGGLLFVLPVKWSDSHQAFTVTLPWSMLQSQVLMLHLPLKANLITQKDQYNYFLIPC